MILEGIRQESAEQYRAAPGLNASTLVHALKSWKQFRYVQQHGYRPKVSTAVGSGLHTLVECWNLDVFDSMFGVMPNFKRHPDNVTKAGNPSRSATDWSRAQEEAFQANEDREIITEAESRRIRRMVQAIEDHKEATHLIASSQREVSVYANLWGVDCKGRLDGICGDVQWDLKTTRDVTPGRFGKDAANMRYVCRLAFYWLLLRECGREINEVKIIAVQDSKPLEDGTYNEAPECVVNNVPMIAIENQVDVIRRLLGEYQDCQLQDRWPGIADGPLVIPNWSMGEEELV